MCTVHNMQCYGTTVTAERRSCSYAPAQYASRFQSFTRSTLLEPRGSIFSYTPLSSVLVSVDARFAFCLGKVTRYH